MSYTLNSDEKSYFCDGFWGGETIEDIVIASEYNAVTSITSSAFIDRKELKSVVISKNVTNIDYDTFNG